MLLCTIWHAVYFATVYLVSDAVGVFPANDDNPRGLAWDSPSKLEALGSSSGQSPFRATQSEFLGWPETAAIGPLTVPIVLPLYADYSET